MKLLPLLKTKFCVHSVEKMSEVHTSGQKAALGNGHRLGLCLSKLGIDQEAKFCNQNSCR